MSEVLWQPNKQESDKSQMAVLIKDISKQFKLTLKTYTDLHQWACANPDKFWEFYANSVQIVHKGSYRHVRSQKTMPGVKWFAGATLNYAQKCLRFNDKHTAIINANEYGEINRTSYKELAQKVARCQSWLYQQGIRKGDRIAAIVTNCEETIVMFLACASIGAIWTSCSPDFGEDAILSRFQQVDPKCLVFVDQYLHKSKTFTISTRIKSIMSQLSTIECCMQLDRECSGTRYEDISRYSIVQQTESNTHLIFEKMDFNDPLYILYSSGTTGTPKSMVHSIGGSLLEHIKEQQLHCDMTRDDVVFYYTSCSWMMWNWLVSALATGSTLLVFDGAPFAPNKYATWELIDQYNISIYGTSAKYINASRNFNLDVKNRLNLQSLRLILSTGSPLYDDDFDYIYQQVKEDVQLCSISGGTDIVGCFALGNPLMPVRKGQLQSASLGYPVNAYDEDAKPCLNTKAELVCEGPVPSMPIYFWDDEDFSVYKRSYFSKYGSVWSQADFVIQHDTGGYTFLGRSDATLNRAGIRIGTAEIYQRVEDIDGILDSLIIHIERTDHMILFVKCEQQGDLSPALKSTIKNDLKNRLSPRHSPNFIFEVPSIPYTKNGKKIEIAIKQLFMNNEDKINVDSLADSSVLNAYKEIRDSAFAPA